MKLNNHGIGRLTTVFFSAVICVAVALGGIYVAQRAGVFTYQGSTQPYDYTKDQPEYKPSPSYIYSGPLRAYVPEFVWANSSSVAVRSGLPDVYVYHKDKVTLFGMENGATGYVDGDLYASDGGTLWMVLDYSTSTDFYCMNDQIVAQQCPYIKAGSLSNFDHDNDGYKEYIYELDFSSLGPLSAGETTKNKYVNLYVGWAETPTIVSLVNATTSSTGYNDLTCEFYFSSWAAEGYGLALSDIRLMTGKTAGSTDGSNNLWDNSSVIFQSLEIVYRKGSAPKTYTAFSSALSTATNSSTINMGLENQNDPYLCPVIWYDKSAGGTFASIHLNFKCNDWGASYTFLVYLNIKYMKGDGTTATIYDNTATSSYPYCSFSAA